MKIIITESQYRILIEQEDYTEQLLSLINSNNETNLEMVKEMMPGLGIDINEFVKDNILKIKPLFKPKFKKLGIDMSENNLSDIFKNAPNVRFEIGSGDLTGKVSISSTDYDNNVFTQNFEGFSDYWEKIKYYGNKKYIENNSGYWEKVEYDSNHNEIYYENSLGKIIDNR